MVHKKPIINGGVVALWMAITVVFFHASAVMAYASSETQQDTIAWNSPLPFDDGVLVGKLDNGFTYYIRKNTEPKDRVVMYLATNVGSILENEDELGLAHFMEHMNFNGTKNFPKNDLVHYLQSAGVRFGSDLNAYTGFEQTVYQLPIPSDDPELLQNGLQVLRDWAQDALLEEEEIDKERGVVLEEMGGSRGAMQRMQDQYLPMIFNGSRYADRLPIGTKEVISNFDYQTLRDFHYRWYRPDLQALIVVGDIDVAEMESQIKSLFSDLKTPTDKPERPEYTVPLLGENQFLAVTDPEMTATVVQIFVKHPEKKVKTVGDFRHSVERSLFNQMVSNRFAELVRQSDPPFIQGGGSIGGFMNGLDALSMLVVAKPGELERGITAVLTEFERIKQHGFTASEFERAKSNYITQLESRYNERDKRTSDSYVQSYLSHFLDDRASLSNEDSYRISRFLVGSIQFEEINRLADEYYTDDNRDILVLAPEREKENLPEGDQVLAWMAAVQASEIEAYADDVMDEPLLKEMPAGGNVVERRELASIGVVDLKLDNGVRVLLKPTDFKNDEIRMTASSPGGTSLYSDEDYFSASYATSLVMSSGLADYNATQFNNYRAGKRVSVAPYIQERSQGFSASSSKQDLATAFEWIYLYYTAPRMDMEAFEGLLSRTRASLANRADDPNAVFADTINHTLYGDNVRRNTIDIPQLQAIDAQRAFEIYKERFSDASALTVTIVGSFTEEEITPLIEQFLAALPSQNRGDQARDLGLYPPAKGVEKTVYRGQEQEQASVRLMYYGDYDYSLEENAQLDALESVLNIKLIERLREAESGVYGVAARSSYSKEPRGRYSFGIYFGTSPGKYEDLTASALDEVDKVRKNGPDQVDIDKFKIEQQRMLEVQLKENGFWLGHISNSVEKGEDPAYILTYLDELDKITVESVKAIANKYLVQDRMYKFVLLPEVQ